MLQRFLTFVSHMPQIWNGLRWIAEAGYRRHYVAIDAALAPRRADGRRFIDFGCGTGQFAGRFPAERYVGIDPTRPYIRYAAGHRPGSFAVMDGTCLGLAPSTFGGALVLGVFHHLPDEFVRASIHELHQALAPEATLLVIEDVPPPTAWNVPGRMMHWLDRGDHIRTDRDYRSLFAPHFAVQEGYTMRSGICDYQVYVLARQALLETR
jgi:SAM-dependent methyltransferase